MFYELHTRSAFSFLSSGSVPEEMVSCAAELGIAGIGLLDRDTVSGAVRFHFEAKRLGLKPIIGAEITLEDKSLLPLVPMNLKGYQNLSRLITTIKLRNKKGEHFATRKDIEEHSAHLMCFTGGADGFIPSSIRSGRGLEEIAWLNSVFEKRLYVELQRHHLRNEEAVNQSLLAFAHKLRLPYFASNGAYYADQEGRELFDVFTCIKNHCTIYDAGNLLSENSERYLKSEPQMRKLFEDYPEAVDVTREIAARIDFSLEELSYSFPTYPVKPGETTDSVLRAKTIERSIDRYRDKPWALRSQVLGRLEKEFRVIEMKGLAGYFLTVSDIADFCRERNILSQGRGSAANSVVCYSLGITAVEPIANKLLFERFLSEKYEQYPDIDIDLPSGDDRESVIQHVYEKYGRRGSGMTANVICYRGRSAVREVGKTFGFGPEVLDRLSRLNSHYETFKGEELNSRLKEEGFDPSDSFKLQKFGELYNRILDFPRHLGQHSGGMVVSHGCLDGIVPLEPASMVDRTIIQWDKDDCENLKIVKIDLLGLGMMAVLRDTITLIREHHGKDLDLYRLPIDDKKVFEALQNADTIGMFQVESRAQISFLPKTKPATFYDIVVQVAIIRPGPIAGKLLGSYIKRRQGLEPIGYIHPDLEANLKRTLGVPLFQEQLLKIAMDLAGFTGGEAEELRRAMGFKRPDIRLQRIAENLRAGMTRRKVDSEAQESIVKCVMAFANYGFPESHAYSFALLAYASAYFMVHYRHCFMTAMLNNYPLGFYSAATLVKDAQRHGLHFKPIDVNRSQYLCVIENERVRVGLKFVKGLRQEIGEKIAAEREASGHYTCIEHLIGRVPEINKREIRALSLAGALNFDNTIHRRQALWQSELAIQPKGSLFVRAELKQDIQDRGKTSAIVLQNNCPSASLYPDHPVHPVKNSLSPLTSVSAVQTNADIIFFKRLEGLQLVETDLRKTGISIGKHPMAFIREEMKKRGILSAEDTRALKRGDLALVAGAVIIRQRPMTANNVVFMTLEDETGHSNFIVMPDTFKRFRSIINQHDFLVIKAVLEERGMLKALYFKPINAIDVKVVSHDFR